MVTLQARCPSCRETVVIEPSQTRVTPPLPGEEGEVVFSCPACASTVSMPVDDLMAEQLLRHGAAPTAEQVRLWGERPPVGYDDLLDFHELLDRDDWFDRLLALTG